MAARHGQKMFVQGVQVCKCVSMCVECVRVSVLVFSYFSSALVYMLADCQMGKITNLKINAFRILFIKLVYSCIVASLSLSQSPHCLSLALSLFLLSLSHLYGVIAGASCRPEMKANQFVADAQDQIPLSLFLSLCLFL